MHTGIRCDLVGYSVKARPPCFPYTAAEEFTRSFLDPAFSLSDTPQQVLDMLLWLCSLALQSPDKSGGALWTSVSHSIYQASVLGSITELEHSSLVRGILNTGPLRPVVLKFLMQGHLLWAFGIWTLCLPSFYTLLKELSKHLTSSEGKLNIFVWIVPPREWMLEDN